MRPGFPRLFVASTAVWTPEFPSQAHWLARTPEPTKRPAAALIDARSRRRCSLLTRMAAEVAEAAAASAGVALATLPMVLGSADGELQTTIRLLGELFEGDGSVSPTRFHNSVHNTAAGTISIGGGMRGEISSVAAGEATFAMALLDLAALLAQRGGMGLLVVSEGAIPQPLVPESYAPAAAALVLSIDPIPGRPVLHSLGLRPGLGASNIPNDLKSNPVSAALALIDLLAHPGSHASVPATVPALGAISPEKTPPEAAKNALRPRRWALSVEVPPSAS